MTCFFGYLRQKFGKLCIIQIIEKPLSQVRVIITVKSE